MCHFGPETPALQRATDPVILSWHPKTRLASMNPLHGLLALACLAPFAAVGLSNPTGTLQEEAVATSESSRPAVLVTGASSGIGLRTTQLLSREGFHVYAGARKDADLQALDALDNVEAIRLDVTVPEEIRAAVATVHEKGRGLFGLINNAGVVVMGPLIEMSEEDLAFQMDVNVTGPFAVTKAFAPLLIESRGRVGITGSISGTLTWGMGGAYCMSKHAVEAYGETLSKEMEPFGVEVAVIEPGNYRSDIAKSMKERLDARGYDAADSRYAETMSRILDGNQDRSQYEEPDDVAQAFLDLLTAEEPKEHYLVCPNAREAHMTVRAAIRRVVELNRDQPYELSRDALVALIDEALAEVAK